MQIESLYNLEPAGAVLVVGLLVALVPVISILRRDLSFEGRYRALVVLTLVITFDLVVFGAFTRLTDSGLGCPDWPGCYGQSNPLSAHTEIQQAQTAMPTGPVTVHKAWIEMVHRYLATGVGALILAMVLFYEWLRRLPGSSFVPSWFPTMVLLWVCVQGAFGALTVTMKLFPAIVTLHLLGGVGLLGMLTLEVNRVGGTLPVLGQIPSRDGFPLQWVRICFALVLIQMALGGWVSTNYAVLACQTVPLCQGVIWPNMNWAAGFELWRPLGQTAAGANLPFEALTAIHIAHRLFAMVVFFAVLKLVHQLWVPNTLRYAKVLLALISLQVATGLSNVVLGWPLLAALLHTAGAGAMMITLVAALTPSVIQQSGIRR